MKCFVFGLLAVAACGGPGSHRSPHDLLQRYIEAVETDRPDDAYQLLGQGVRQKLSREAFARRWRSMRGELADQARRLRNRAEKPVSLEATVDYPAGIQVNLSYRGSGWQLEEGFPVSVPTTTPLAATMAFLRALEQRNYPVASRLLARTWRDRLGEDAIEELKQLRERMDLDKIRSRTRQRIEIQLIREGDQWKILKVD
jgi:hypothetical protein